MNVETAGARGQLTEGNGWCVGVLTCLSWFLVFVTLPWSLCVCLKVILNPFLSTSVCLLYGDRQWNVGPFSFYCM